MCSEKAQELIYKETSTHCNRDLGIHRLKMPKEISPEVIESSNFPLVFS
jgi:hypothetical protein